MVATGPANNDSAVALAGASGPETSGTRVGARIATGSDMAVFASRGARVVLRGVWMFGFVATSVPVLALSNCMVVGSAVDDCPMRLASPRELHEAQSLSCAVWDRHGSDDESLACILRGLPKPVCAPLIFVARALRAAEARARICRRM